MWSRDWADSNDAPCLSANDLQLVGQLKALILETSDRDSSMGHGHVLQEHLFLTYTLPVTDLI